MLDLPVAAKAAAVPSFGQSFLGVHLLLVVGELSGVESRLVCALILFYQKGGQMPSRSQNDANRSRVPVQISRAHRDRLRVLAAWRQERMGALIERLIDQEFDANEELRRLGKSLGKPVGLSVVKS